MLRKATDTPVSSSDVVPAPIKPTSGQDRHRHPAGLGEPRRRLTAVRMLAEVRRGRLAISVQCR